MLISRTHRIAVMSAFLSMDFVLGFLPVTVFVPFLDFILLFMIVNLIGWKLGLTWYGLGFLPIIPRLITGGGLASSVTQVTLNLPHLKPYPITWPEPFNSIGIWIAKVLVNTAHNVSPIGQTGLVIIAFGYLFYFYGQMILSAYQWTKYFWVRIIPPLGSKIDARSYAKSTEIRDMMNWRRMRRKARKLGIKNPFGVFWFILDPFIN